MIVRFVVLVESVMVRIFLVPASDRVHWCRRVTGAKKKCKPWLRVSPIQRPSPQSGTRLAPDGALAEPTIFSLRVLVDAKGESKPPLQRELLVKVRLRQPS